MELRARPTTYRGVVMRSRLETSVAAWLDRHQFDWTYEPERFATLAGGLYIPDFRIEGWPRDLTGDDSHDGSLPFPAISRSSPRTSTRTSRSRAWRWSGSPTRTPTCCCSAPAMQTGGVTTCSLAGSPT